MKELEELNNIWKHIKMIINLKNKKDLVTVDISAKQIRYLKDIKNRGAISFIDLNNDGVSGYEYLYKNDKRLFKKSLQEDLWSSEGIKVNVKDLRFVKLQ